MAKQKALLLLSGGIDSPVAGWVLKEQGLDLEALHFSNKIAGREAEEKTKRLAKKLGIKLHVIEIGGELARISQEAEHRDYFVLMKRLMLKAGEKVARKRGCEFLAKGDNLAQVSSQTLKNLAVIDKATGMEVLRPLLGLDKIEIVRKAEKIGTFEISKGKECCDILGPEKAETRAILERILEEEESLGIGKMVSSIVSKL